MISPPSLHTLNRSPAARIGLTTEATDTRCGFDRLAESVRAVRTMEFLYADGDTCTLMRPDTFEPIKVPGSIF